MARKSNVKVASLSTGDVDKEETKDVIDVNLASQAGDESKEVDGEENVLSDESVTDEHTTQAGDESKEVDGEENVLSDESVTDEHATQEDNTEEQTSGEASTVKPSTEDQEPPTTVNNKELTKSLELATGIRGLDIDKILSECKTDDDKKKAFERVLWHIGRIKSCNIASHLMHQGRFNQDGTESKLVKDLKTVFSQK